MGDVIVSSIEGSLDSIALINEEYDHALCLLDSMLSTQRHSFRNFCLYFESIVDNYNSKKDAAVQSLQQSIKMNLQGYIANNFRKKTNSNSEKSHRVFQLRKQSKHSIRMCQASGGNGIEQDEQNGY